MPRSKLIEELHQAAYDLRWARGTEDEAAAKEHHAAIFAAVLRHFQCTKEQLHLALDGDFGKWWRDSGLHPPPNR